MANYTLNYTGEKVDELLNKIDTAFGETTVMGDTLTWDGDMTGKEYVEMEIPIDDEGNTTTIYFVNVSDSVPTIEDLQNGGNFNAAGQIVAFPDNEEPTDIGSAIMISQNILIAKEDSADLTDILGVVLPKKGVYFISMPAMGSYVGSFTINNYTGFERTEVKTIDLKYLPFGGVMRVDVLGEGLDMGTMEFINPISNKSFAEINSHIDSGEFVFAHVVLSDTMRFFLPVVGYGYNSSQEVSSVNFSAYQSGATITLSIGVDGEISGSYALGQ